LERPPAYVLPPPHQPLIPEFSGLDPLLDRPRAPLPGWFVNAESSVVGVHLTNQLTNTLTLSATRTDTVRFPGNPLNWTVTPRFEFGYRLPDGWGALQIGYRFLTTEGSDLFAVTQGAPTDAAQKGRLDINIIDLDYVSREYSLGPNWEMRWAVGVRAFFLYFDSQLSFLNASPNPGDVLTQLETNHVYLYGFHGVLDLSRKTPVPGLAIFGRLDGSGMVGRIGQTYSESLAPTPDGSRPAFAQTRLNRTDGVPTLAAEVGLTYTVPAWNNSRFLLGYQYETFWEMGRIAETGSRAQVNIQGVFLRAEFNF
jgi:hypothetical protein